MSPPTAACVGLDALLGFPPPPPAARRGELLANGSRLINLFGHQLMMPPDEEWQAAHPAGRRRSVAKPHPPPWPMSNVCETRLHLGNSTSVAPMSVQHVCEHGGCSARADPGCGWGRSSRRLLDPTKLAELVENGKLVMRTVKILLDSADGEASRRRDCHFTSTLHPHCDTLLKKEGGGAVE